MLLHWLKEKHIKVQVGIRTGKGEGWRRMIRKFFFCLHWEQKIYCVSNHYTDEVNHLLEIIVPSAERDGNCN